MSDDSTGTNDTGAATSSTLEVAGDDYLVVSVPLADAEIMADLTAAEREVARAILEGLSDTEIAERRGASLNTIRNQVSAIFEKLEVESRYELVARLAGEPNG